MDLALLSQFLWRFRLDELSPYDELLLHSHSSFQRTALYRSPREQRRTKLSTDGLLYCSGYRGEYFFGDSLLLVR